MKQLFFRIPKSNRRRLSDQVFIQVERFIFDNLILTRNQLGHKVSQRSNEWELNNGVGHVEGTVRKSNRHFRRQMQEALEVFNHGCKRCQQDQTKDCSDQVKEHVGCCNTLGRNIGPHSCNNNRQGCSNIIPKKDRKRTTKI